MKHVVHVEWGPDGLSAQLDDTDVFVIVDVLSFSTCVDVAVDRGARVVPALVGSEARMLARSLGAECGGERGARGVRYTLSPASIASAPEGALIVLPSPNGATLSRMTQGIPTFSACLRNAAAVAGAAMQVGRRITIVAAGEQWPGGTLRPALEDWLGAGAVVARMAAERTPDATAAQTAFQAARGRLIAALVACRSGMELVDKGYEQDVRIAAELDATRRAPLLVDGAYLAVEP